MDSRCGFLKKQETHISVFIVVLSSVGFTDQYRGDALTTFHDVVYVSIGYRVGLPGMTISLHHYIFTTFF